MWFKPDASIGEIKLGRFLGISRNTGSLMSYYVLPASGIPVSCTTVQRVTELEKQTDANREHFNAFTKSIADRYQEGRLYSRRDKLDLEEW